MTACVLAGIGLLALGWHNATVEPLVRSATLTFRDWPAGAAPVRVLLMSDLHVGGPDMPAERLARIVAQANAQKPDLVLLAGDYVGDHPLLSTPVTAEQMAAPLRELTAPLGVVAVMGNHDQRRGRELRAAFRRNGVTVLDNQVVQRGPLTIGGVDDAVTGHADLKGTFRAMQAMPGPRLLLSHDPAVVTRLPGPIDLLLAGHTHCGQVSLPLIGSMAWFVKVDDHMGCGLVRPYGQQTIVTAGVGTSGLPIRIGVPSELWLVTLGPG